MKQGLKLKNYWLLALITCTLLMACSSDDDEMMQPSPLATHLGYDRQNPLIFSIDADYAPLEFVDENGTPQGFDVEFTGLWTSA